MLTENKLPLSKKLGNFIANNFIAIFLFLMIIVIIISEPSFLSTRVLRDLMLQNATKLIMAAGIQFILIGGRADMSGGRSVGMAAIIVASLVQRPDYGRLFFGSYLGIPVFVGIVIAVLFSIVFGALNGIVITRLSVPPFIATWGMQVLVYGVGSIYYTIEPNAANPVGGLVTEFTDLGSGYIGKVPILIIFAVVCVVLGWIILSRTQFGRNVYASGGNREAARVSGINTDAVDMAIYMIAGFTYGLTGVLEAARTGGATNLYGQQYEFDAICSCVVGGVSNSGGIGTTRGLIIGVFVFGVLNYGMTYIGINPYWQLIMKGLVINAAVAVDVRKYRRLR